MAYKEYQPHGISVNAAAKKYGIPQATLSNWARRGIIKVLEYPKGHGFKMVVDEATVALVARYYRPSIGQLQKRGFSQVRELSPQNCPFCGRPLDDKQE